MKQKLERKLQKQKASSSDRIIMGKDENTMGQNAKWELYKRAMGYNQHNRIDN